MKVRPTCTSDFDALRMGWIYRKHVLCIKDDNQSVSRLFFLSRTSGINYRLLGNKKAAGIIWMRVLEEAEVVVLSFWKLFSNLSKWWGRPLQGGSCGYCLLYPAVGDVISYVFLPDPTQARRASLAVGPSVIQAQIKLASVMKDSQRGFVLPLNLSR